MLKWKFLLVLLVCLNISCNVFYKIAPFRKFKLPHQWRPLKYVVERPSAGKESFTTLKKTVYTSKYKWFKRLRNTEEGFHEYNAILLHERVHSIRQRGKSSWLSKYISSPHFRWKEEQLGWYVALLHMKKHNLPIHPESIARALSRYGIKFLGLKATGKMVSYQEALQWVNAVLSGQWEPAPGELPADAFAPIEDPPPLDMEAGN